MTQREATVTIIDFVREQAPDDKRILRALKILEKRAEVLRERQDRRRHKYPCPRCRRRDTSCILCWPCWSGIPDALRAAFDGAKTTDAKRAAARTIYEYLRLEETRPSTINPQPSTSA